MTNNNKKKGNSKWLENWVTKVDTEMGNVLVEPESYAKKSKVRQTKRKR